MNPLDRALEYLFGGRKVGGAQQQRLLLWRNAPKADLALPHTRQRYVVVDTETTGVDLRRDRLIAIGAVGIDLGCIDFSDCFQTVLRQERPSADTNILIHRIGGQMQLAGADPKEGMLAFLEYLGKSPLVAFRAEFDEAMLGHGMRLILGLPFRHPWIDLAFLLPALFPDTGCTALDEWLTHFGLGGAERHDALADALATAQLLQIALVAADKVGMTQTTHLIAMQKAQRWLGKR